MNDFIWENLKAILVVVGVVVIAAVVWFYFKNPVRFFDDLFRLFKK